MNLYGNEFEAMNQKAMNLPKNNRIQIFYLSSTGLQ